MGADKYRQQYVAKKVGGLLDFLPGVGEAVGADETKRAFNAGNYGEAALNAGTTVMGAVPGGGDIAAGVAKAIFGGIGAKTANKALLDKAQDMAALGASKDAVWSETGWFKGADGKWRFEIDDSASKIDPNRVALGGAAPNNPNPLRNVLPHEQAYEAYPDVGDMQANMRMDVGGMEGTYHTPRTVGNRLIEGISGTAPTRHDLRSVGLHEMQHAVQSREGFAEGANDAFGHKLDDVWPAAKAAYEDSVGISGGISDDDLLAELLGKPVEKRPTKSWDDLTDRERLAWLERGRQRLYYRNAGEVEARNVQSRMNMTPEQRRATPPWATQDVPDELQIVRHR